MASGNVTWNHFRDNHGNAHDIVVGEKAREGGETQNGVGSDSFNREPEKNLSPRN